MSRGRRTRQKVALDMDRHLHCTFRTRSQYILTILTGTERDVYSSCSTFIFYLFLNIFCAIKYEADKSPVVVCRSLLRCLIFVIKFVVTYNSGIHGGEEHRWLLWVQRVVEVEEQQNSWIPRRSIFVCLLAVNRNIAGRTVYGQIYWPI